MTLQPTKTGAAALAITEPDLMPAFTWDMLNEELASMLVFYPKAGLVGDMVSAHRKMSAFLPPQAVLRGILEMVSTMTDDSFQP